MRGACPRRPGVGNSAPVEAPDTPPTLDQLSNEIRDVALQVHLAEERKDERDVVAAAHAGIERLSRRYRELLQSLSPGEQLRAERALGRRVVDLKRLASLLPKIPAASVESTPDRAAGGGAPEDRRITGVSWSHDRRAPAPKLGVGGDVESWCGRCGEATTHSIVAMVGQEPKQVLCQVCGSRHTHRTGPARRPTASAARHPRRGSSPCRSRGAETGRRAAGAGRRGCRRRHRARLRSEGALQGWRDHRPRRVWARQDRERPALQPARALLGRRPQVADAAVGVVRRRTRAARGGATWRRCRRGSA